MNDGTGSFTHCPGCPGMLKMDESTLRFSHDGPHDSDCLWKTIEPVNIQAVIGYRRGDWKFDEQGNIVKHPPISEAQFKDNVINVDFKNKKKL
jgi:hypothetical protein